MLHVVKPPDWKAGETQIEEGQTIYHTPKYCTGLNDDPRADLRT